jgi:hypothetical protein
MTYIKINSTLYPATVSGRVADKDWDNRASKAITLEMDYATAIALFVDGLAWSIVQQNEVPTYQVDENGEVVLDENGNPIQTGTEIQETEWDNGDYDVAGAITDHRNGTITVKMGKITDAEALAELMEVLA